MQVALPDLLASHRLLCHPQVFGLLGPSSMCTQANCNWSCQLHLGPAAGCRFLAAGCLLHLGPAAGCIWGRLPSAVTCCPAAGCGMLICSVCERRCALCTLFSPAPWMRYLPTAGFQLPALVCTPALVSVRRSGRATEQHLAPGERHAALPRSRAVYSLSDRARRP